MTVYVPVAGTNAKKRKHQWASAGSLFDVHLANLGFQRKAEAFGVWSTALAGTFFTGSGHLVWQFGARQFYEFMWGLPFEERNGVVHSHAGAIVAYALALKPRLVLRSLITIDCPMPKSLDAVWAEAKGSTKTHVHLYSTGWGSRMRWLGQRGRFKRQMEWATYNFPIAGGHSGILRAPKHIPQIDEALALVAVR